MWFAKTIVFHNTTLGDGDANFGAEPGNVVPEVQAGQPPAPAIDPALLNLLQLLQQGLGGGGGSQRAKASVDAATPHFRGDHTDKVNCGR